MNFILENLKLDDPDNTLFPAVVFSLEKMWVHSPYGAVSPKERASKRILTNARSPSKEVDFFPKIFSLNYDYHEYCASHNYSWEDRW